MVDAVEQALEECATKVAEGALPRSLDGRAIRYLRGAVHENFKKHIGNWAEDRQEVLRMAWHLGAMANLIASIRNEAVISEHVAKDAGRIVSHNCKIGQMVALQARGAYCQGAFETE
jgi:hypothetical protein